MRAVFAAALLLAGSGTAAFGATATQSPGYQAENVRLARSTPHYPRARLLTSEQVWGNAGAGEFEAIQRVYSLARTQTQRAVTAFYARRLGADWERRGAACHVSGSRLIVAVVHGSSRRLGVLVDSRGAQSCRSERRLLTQLLNVGQ